MSQYQPARCVFVDTCGVGEKQEGAKVLQVVALAFHGGHNLPHDLCSLGGSGVADIVVVGALTGQHTHGRGEHSSAKADFRHGNKRIIRACAVDGYAGWTCSGLLMGCVLV